MGRLGRNVLVEGALLASLLVAFVALFARGLRSPADYDEGVYLASVDALRHGQELGTQIFTPQPPAFYELMRLGDVLFGNTLDGVRWTVIACAVLALLAAWALVRVLSGPAAGLGALALLGACTPFPTFASRISADLPAYSIGLAGLVCAALARRRASPAWLAAGGAVLGTAVLVKLSAVTLVVPALVLAWPLRRRVAAAAALAGGFAVPFLAVVVLAFDQLHGLWNGAVAYHETAQGGGGPSTANNLSRVVHFFDVRTPASWLVLVALVLVALGLGGRRRDLAALWLWALVGAGFLVWHRPLHDNHMVLLAFGLALPAGGALGSAAARLRGLRAAAALSVLGVVLAAAYTQEWRRLGRNQGPEPPAITWAAARLAATTGPGELVLADHPYAAFLAHRQVPGELVDTATLRFESGFLTTQAVLETIERRHVAAVAAVRAFRDRPELLRALARRFPHRRSLDGVATVFSSRAARGR
ncbi:MAG: hypothetical protein QOH73_1794 [Gaiellaceae bacterium]|nr:hypothetical protein [Gaiellaceae bacterium]